MSLETSLQQILQQLNPSISTDTFVFVAINNQSLLKVLGYDPIAFFKEPEGITLVLRKEEADNNMLAYDKELCRITFNAPYHFECAGFNAIIASHLQKQGLVLPPLRLSTSVHYSSIKTMRTQRSKSYAPFSKKFRASRHTN